MGPKSVGDTPHGRLFLQPRQEPAQGDIPATVEPSRGEQVDVPYPPGRDNPVESHLARRTSPAGSHRHDTIRIHLPAPIVPWGRLVDLTATSGTGMPLAGDGQRPAADPSMLFGPDIREVFIVSGHQAFGHLATPLDNEHTLVEVQHALDDRDWAWHRVVIFPTGREWAEVGALILNGTQEQVCALALRHGQERVLRWDSDGLVSVPTQFDDHSRGEPATCLMLGRATVGCPMRFGDGSRTCIRQGGPWVSRSMQVAVVWEAHRALLVDALGCSVCGGGQVSVDGGPVAMVDLFTPSRHRGWQWAPRSDV